MEIRNIKETLINYEENILNLCNKVHQCNDALIQLDDILETYVSKISLTDYLDELLLKDLINKKFTSEYMLNLKHVFYNYLDNNNNATQFYHYFKIDGSKFTINFKTNSYLTLQSLQYDCKLLDIILKRIEESIKELS